MSAPNIRPRRPPHSDCWKQDAVGPLFRFPGDVRFCLHGRIQVLTAAPPGGRVGGPATNWWRTLSPVLNPVLHRRAKAALTASRNPNPEETK